MPARCIKAARPTVVACVPLSRAGRSDRVPSHELPMLHPRAAQLTETPAGCHLGSVGLVCTGVRRAHCTDIAGSLVAFHQCLPVPRACRGTDLRSGSPYVLIQVASPSSSTATYSGPWRSSAEAVMTTSAPASR